MFYKGFTFSGKLEKIGDSKLWLFGAADDDGVFLGDMLIIGGVMLVMMMRFHLETSCRCYISHALLDFDPFWNYRVQGR